jgi:hypothetical protein
MASAGSVSIKLNATLSDEPCFVKLSDNRAIDIYLQLSGNSTLSSVLNYVLG